MEQYEADAAAAEFRQRCEGMQPPRAVDLHQLTQRLGQTGNFVGQKLMGLAESIDNQSVQLRESAEASGKLGEAMLTQAKTQNWLAKVLIFVVIVQAVIALLGVLA